VVARIENLSYIRHTKMDTFDSNQRSEIMRRVHSSGTLPEMIVRGIVRRMGVSYRSCPRHLPGKPDLVMAEQQKAILVHGCFWHGGGR
jgi:DNA mismatch endonuclease (patch repair protein)